MSVKVMSLVWDSTVPSPERLTLLALADRANEEGVCEPSVPTLARKCQAGDRTIQRHFRTLEELGVLAVMRNYHTRSVYKINLPRLVELQDPEPCQSGTPVNLTGRQSGSPVNLSRQEETRRSGKGCQSGSPANLAASSKATTTTPPVLHAEPDLTMTQVIVGEWLERCAKRPPGRIIGQVSKLIKEMVDEGVDPDDIKRGMAEWMRKKLMAPSLIPSVVNEVMNSHSKHSQAEPALSKNPRRAFVQLRNHQDCRQAGRLIGVTWIEPSQPLSDPTEPAKWLMDRRLAFLDEHEDALIAALAERNVSYG